MSLINQMLKELDARRSDAGSDGPFGGQVRVVREQTTVHPAWWVALALAIAVLVLLAWVLLRPPASDDYLVRAQLPLKLEVDLAMAANSAAPGEPPVALSPEPALIPPTPEIVSLSAPATPSAVREQSAPVPILSSQAATAPVAPPSAPAATQGVAQEPAPKPATVAIAAAGRGQTGSQAAGPISSVAEQEEVARAAETRAVTKHIRELTPRQRAENEFREATLAMQQGRKSVARAGFEQTLQLDARHLGARQALIALLLETGNTDEALSSAQAGLELDERQTGLAMILARLQLEKNDLRGALATLSRARAHADRPDYLAFHAALLQRDEQHKQAAEQYLLALRQAPQNGLWWMGLGISLQAEQRHSEAREAFNRAKASNALSPELAAFVTARLAQLK